jgi:ribosomal protein RSM22 (predicted rRNA methylase)
MLDRNAHLLEMAGELAAASPVLSEAKIIGGDLSGALPTAELVVAGYVLAEIAEARASAVARDLWSVTSNMLVLVEPGTPAGFARIRGAREALIAEGAHVAAPCTHDKPCPMHAPDWCHFSQRLPRSRDHMIAKDADVPFEDERFSYIAVSRSQLPESNRARIVAPPEESKAGITLPLCDDRGLHKGIINRRDRAAFNLLKKAEWGDVIASEE